MDFLTAAYADLTDAMDLDREANVSQAVLPNGDGGVGENAVMTVAIYHPPILPFLGSSIQDDEVSSTIEPDDDIIPLRGSNMTVHDLDGEPPRKSFLLEIKSESESTIKEYSLSEQSPSTSQPSPPELEKPEPGDILELTNVNLLGSEVVSDLPFPKPERDNDSPWDHEGNGVVECSPNIFLDEEVAEQKPTVDPIVSKSQSAAVAAPNTTEKNADPPRIPQLHPAFSLKPCQIILRRCDEGIKGPPRSSQSGSGGIFHDQISDNDMTRLRNLRRTVARQKQETSPPQKDKLKVERRGRPPTLKRLEGSIKGTENGTASTSTENRNRGRPRRKRRGMPGSVRYSRYNKRKYKLKAELLKDSQSLSSGQVKTVAIFPQGHVDNSVLEEELSMMDTCPSPNISEDSESFRDESDNENDLDDDPSSSSNIITAEQARQFVTAWVNTGDGEDESNLVQSSQQILAKSSQPAPSTPTTTPNEFFGDHDDKDDEEGVEEDPEEVETKPLLKCSTCSKTFDNPMTLQVHMRLHTGERPYKCKCCGEAFIHYTYLEYHYKNTHGGSNPSTKSEAEPKKGRKLKGKGRGKGTSKISGSGRNCRIALFPPKAVVSPKKTKSPPKRARPVSATAPSKFTAAVGKKSQQSANTPATVRQVAAYICPYCKLSFQHATLLITHLKRHSGDNPFKCPHCDQGFKQSRHLENHIKQSHSKSKTRTTSTLPVPVVPNLRPLLKEVLEEPVSESESEAESFSPSHQDEDPVDEVTANSASAVSNLTMRRLELKQSAEAGKRVDVFAVKSVPPSYMKTSEPEPVDPESDGDFIKIRRFRCNYCGKTFLSADGVKTHIRTHTNERPHQCTHCPTRFNQKVHMEKHVRLIHQPNRNYKFRCTECQGGFQMQGNLARHLKLAHGISSHIGAQSSVQVVANKVTTTKSFVQKRKINSSEQQTIKNKVTTTKTFLKKRRRRQKFYYSNKYWQNGRRQRMASTVVAAPASSSSKMPRKEEECPERDLLRSYVPLTRCDALVKIWMEKKRESSSSASSLYRTRERQSQQQLSPAYFAKKSKPSQAHSRSKKNARSHSTPTKARLKITEADRKKFHFQCAICGKRLKTKYGLDEHGRVHTGEKPFSCKYCGKRFARWNNRYVHLRVHTGLKPYECSICQKAFTQKTTLDNHLRAHQKGTIRGIQKEDEDEEY